MEKRTNKPAPVVNPKKPAVPQTDLMLKQQSALTKFLVITIGLTVLAVAIGGYFIFQLSNLNIKKAAELRAQEGTIKLLKHKQDVLDSSKDVIAELKKASGDKPSFFDLITIRSLPYKSDIESIIGTMSVLEDKTGVVVTNISNETGTAGVASPAAAAASSVDSAVQKLTFSAKVEGSYEAIMDFFRNIEKSARVMDFSNMKISGSDKTISLTVTYQTYFLNEPDLKSQSVALDEFEAKIAADKDAYR